MQIKSLTNIDFVTIFRAFSRAFADYELQLDSTQFQTMLKRRGFNPDLSFAAFEGDEMVAFTLNGTGNFNGLPTAYDTGTGTVKEFRGKGLATGIFEYSIPYLKEAGIEQYLLEVLRHNTKAISVYRKLGFEVSREFNYWGQKNEDIKIISLTPPDITIKEIDPEKFQSIQSFWDFYPSWQNDFGSISRTAPDFIGLGAFRDETLVGYAIFEPVSGDVTQLAIDKANRRKGIATSLLKEMSGLNKNQAIKVINTDIECNSLTAFLKARNIELRGQQFEMIKKI